MRDTGFDTDVSSLAAGTSSVESMLVDVSKNGVYSLETSNLSTGAGSSVQTITLAGRAFVAKPTVTATLIGTANDPIIAVMISDVSETGTSGLYQVTFQFSDELPATGETDQATSYKLNILANVNAADQDLDTIVDSVDSDRDGDGVENSLDYDPDDSSIASFIDTLQPSCDQVALHLQPAAGETIIDKSGNQHTVTTVGNAVVDNTATLFGGDTINFDGTGDYLTVSSSNTLAFGTSDFTIEAWIKSDGSDYFTILQNLPHGSVAQLDDWFFGVSSNTPGMISFNMHGDNAANRVETDPGVFKFDGQFHHVAFIRTSTGCSIWYDGRQVATSDAFNTWNFNKIQDHTIGYRVTPNYSSGAIQDLRISKKAVYTGNFVPPATLHDTCATFVEPSEPACEDVTLHIQPAAGETIADKSGNNHQITVTGDTTVDNTTTLFGAGTINFDGNGDYLTISDGFINLTQDFTIEFWYNPNSFDFDTATSTLFAFEHIQGDVNVTNNHLVDARYTIDINGIRVQSSSLSTTDIDIQHVPANRVPVLGQWVHVAWVKNSGVHTIYHNGVKDISWQEVVQNSSVSGQLNIGSLNSNSGKYNGQIQDFRISKKAVYTDSFTPPTNLLANPC